MVLRGLRSMTMLEENLQYVRGRIADAASRVGREAGDVQLVAVTKYAEPEWVRALAKLHPVFGESRPQQLAERVPQFDPSVTWHLIGQLQRNKVRMTLPLCSLVHSGESVRLLDRIELVAGELVLQPAVLLQVNVSGEASKAGFTPDDLRRLAEKLPAYESLTIDGLMTMAPATSNPESTRAVFAGLRELRDELAASTGLALAELSMGMSGDYEIAIEEGATIVRVGSRLFDGLGYRA